MSVIHLGMVEPVAFGYNAETAQTNRFQQAPLAAPDDTAAAINVAAAARAEFSAMVAQLRAAGARVAVAADSSDPVKPDAVFPNNWVSFHDDGTVVLYPMRDPTRRAERRESVVVEFKSQSGFRETRRIDLSAEEQRGRFLEGTGSLVLDRAARVAYACRSARTDEDLVHEWARRMDYRVFVFDAATADGIPVYHTNVLLWIGERTAGVGLEWVAAEQRAALRAELAHNGRQLLLFTAAQLRAFAGNMLEVPVASGQRLLVMSTSAAAALEPSQRAQLKDAGVMPIVCAVPTIERLGGGSVRCMLAEVPALRAGGRA